MQILRSNGECVLDVTNLNNSQQILQLDIKRFVQFQNTEMGKVSLFHTHTHTAIRETEFERERNRNRNKREREKKKRERDSYSLRVVIVL